MLLGLSEGTLAGGDRSVERSRASASPCLGYTPPRRFTKEAAMRIEDQRRSDQVEDRRGMSVGRGVAGGGIGIVVIALIAMFMGIDPGVILQGGLAPDVAPEQQQSAKKGAPSR